MDSTHTCFTSGEPGSGLFTASSFRPVGAGALNERWKEPIIGVGPYEEWSRVFRATYREQSRIDDSNQIEGLHTLCKILHMCARMRAVDDFNDPNQPANPLIVGVSQ